MLRNWRGWVLAILFFGPFLAYIGFGTLWLIQRGWAFYAYTLWVAAGMAFAFLAKRWTRPKRELLPPLDWDAPHTFSPEDRQAWALVGEEAERAEAVAL